MSGVAFKTNFSSPGLSQLQELKKKTPSLDGGKAEGSGESFFDHLKDKISEVNTEQHAADKMSADIASGRSDNIHEAMLAMSSAELNFDFMVQVRNKALEAYQEVMRMPV